MLSYSRVVWRFRDTNRKGTLVLAPGKHLEIVSLLCCSKEGLESVGLALITKDVLTARNPVVNVVDVTGSKSVLTVRHTAYPFVATFPKAS